MKLTIYIPTYNRADKLRRCLTSLAPQINNEGVVEVVISDNASEDDTADVVAGFQKPGVSIRYFKNPKNLGIAHNIIKSWDYAEGEFCWLVGDDEIITPGAVDTIVETIESNPGIDFIFVNSLSLRTSDLPEMDGATDPESVQRMSKELIEEKGKTAEFLLSKRTETGPLDFEELLDQDIDGIYLGSLMVAVYRTAVVKGAITPSEIKEPFVDTINSYPHTVAFIRTMPGRRAFHRAEPATINFWGDREWGYALPAIWTLRLTELVEDWAAAGVSHERTERMRKHQISRAAKSSKELFKSGVFGSNSFNYRLFMGSYFEANKKKTLRIIRRWIIFSIKEKLSGLFRRAPVSSSH